MRKVSWIELSIATILAMVIVIFFFNEKVSFSDLALGEATKRVQAEDSTGKFIHIVEMDGSDSVLLAGWEGRGKLPVTLVLGNSQSHSINQWKEGDKTFVALLHDTLKKQGIDVLGHSIPNANLQEFLLMYEYWTSKVPVKTVVLPVFMDDLRELGIREVFFDGMVKGKFKLTDTLDSEVARINLEFKKFGAGSEKDAAGNAPVMKEKQTAQDAVETAFNGWLDSNFTPWALRPNIRGSLFNELYKFRNTVFGITPGTKRKMMPARVDLNLSALESILKSASQKGIKVVLYIPPIRHDVPIPYDDAEYASFKERVNKMAAQYKCSISDYDTLVPGELWGSKAATNGSGDLEIDFMHFQGHGHILLTNKILTQLENK